MSYATEQDLIDRFGESELIQLTDRAAAGTVDLTVSGRALSDADAEINGYLAGRYTLPLSSTPEVLVRIAADMARYYLFGSAVPEVVRTRYEDAVRLLKAIASGQVDIGVDALGNKPISSAGAQMVGEGKVFSRADKGFM